MLKKSFLVIGMVLTLLMASIAPAFADTEGSVTGKFGINAPPTVDSVSLTPTSMTPQESYTVSVQVTDSDMINDLHTVVLKLWYDNDGGTPTADEFNSQSADAKVCAVITWTATNPGGTTYTGSAALTPAGTTWSLGTCTLPTKGNGQNPGDFGSTSFTFQFVFTVGKVATQTTGSARWQIAAEATDSKNQVSAWSTSSYDAEGATMNFYGEISVPGATIIDWGDLKPGIDFASTQKALGVTLGYIANGAYDKKVKSSTPWSGSSHTANLDSTGNCGSAQQFALKADDTATYTNAVLVDTTGVVIDNAGLQTTESGDSITTMNLWLKLASTFAKDTYSGTITYIIANH